MRVKYCKWIGMGLIIISAFQLTGCNFWTSNTVMRVLDHNEEVETFYGEGKERFYIDNEMVQECTFKETKGKNGHYYSEAVIKSKKEFFEEYYEEEITEDMIQDGLVVYTEKDIFTSKQMILYLSHRNEYCIKDINLAQEVTDSVRIGIDRVLEIGSFEDYVMQLIAEYEMDYNLTIVDDVKVNGYLTQHITALPKDETKKESIEFWVDQNTWLIVKSRDQVGDCISEMEYSKYSINPKVDESIFHIEIPEDAKITYVNDSLEEINEVVTLEEAVERLGIPIFYIDEPNVKLKEIRYIERVDQKYGQVELTYTLENGEEFLIRNGPSSIVYEKLQLGYEKITIREGVEASYIESGSIRTIEFIEQGTICDVYIRNSQVTKEELIELTNHLKTAH